MRRPILRRAVLTCLLLLAQYHVARGHLWPFVLAAVALAPFAWARRGPSS